MSYIQGQLTESEENRELELYQYELTDGSKGHIAANSVLNAHEQLQGRGVKSVQEFEEKEEPITWGVLSMS